MYFIYLNAFNPSQTHSKMQWVVETKRSCRIRTHMDVCTYAIYYLY